MRAHLAARTSASAGSHASSSMMTLRQPVNPLRTGFLAVALFISTITCAQPPQRIMSLNLCADVLLLHLADPGQIRSITFLAGSSPLSPVIELAKGLPSNYGTAEEVLALEPDLVLVHRYSNIHLVQALEKLGFRLLRIEAPSTLEAAARQIESLSTLLGHAERGLHIAEQLRQLPDLSNAPSKPVTAIYGPNGMTATPGALLHNLLERAGLTNFAALHQLPDNGRIPLETLLTHPPQALVLSGEHNQRSNTLAQETLQHPALAGLAGNMPMTRIPSRYWSCGGPELMEAFTRLQQLRNTVIDEGTHAH